MKLGVAFIVSSLLLQTARAGETRGLDNINSEITLSPKSQARMAAALDGSVAKSKKVVTTKRFEVSGPMVQPFKEKTIGNFPGRLLRLVNPFAKGEPKEPVIEARGVSPRAWSSTVGWRVGASTFADAVDHESSLGLVSVGRRAD